MIVVSCQPYFVPNGTLFYSNNLFFYTKNSVFNMVEYQRNALFRH